MARGRRSLRVKLASSGCCVSPSEGKLYRAHKGASATALEKYFNLGPVLFGRDIGAVKNGDGLAGECAAGEGLAVAVDAFREILKLLGVAVLPGLVRCGLTPALLGPDLLDDVHVFEQVFLDRKSVV